MKIRRVIWIAGLSVTALLLVFGILHTPLVRRAVLLRLSEWIGKPQGLTLQAGSLDYNLLSPWIELREVSLRAVSSGDLPAFLSASRIHARLQYSSLLHGAFKVRELRIEGLQLRVAVRSDGQGNLPRRTSEAPGGTGPRLSVESLAISDLSLSYDDDRSGLSLRLPAASLNGEAGAATSILEFRYALLSRGLFRWKDKQLDIDRLELDAALEPDRLAIRALRLAAGDSTIQAGGAIHVSDPPRLDLDVQADLAAAAVSPWIGLSNPLAGRIQTRLNFSGDMRHPVAEGELRSDALKWGEFECNTASTRVRLDLSAGTLEWKELAATLFGGRLSASGRLALREPGQSVLEAELRQWDFRRTPGAQGVGVLPRGLATLKLTAACPGMQWDQADLKAGATLRLTPEKPGTGNSTIQGAFKGRVRGNRLQVDIDSVTGYGASMRGAIGVDTREQSLSGQIQGTARSLSQFVRGLETDLGVRSESRLPAVPEGTAEWRATLSGSIRNPQAAFDFAAADLSAGPMAGARLTLRGGYAGSLLRIEQARLEWRKQAVTASGEIGFGSASAPLRFEASMENASAADLLEGLGIKTDLQATADARVSAGGTLSQPQLDIRIGAREIMAYGEPLGRLEGEALWRNGTLEISRLRLEKPQEGGSGTMEARGTYHPDTGAFQFSLAGEELRMVSLRLPGDLSLLGALRLKAQGQGTLEDPVIQWEVEGKELQLAGYDLGLLRAVLNLSDHRARLKVESGTSGAVADAEIALSPAYPMRFEIRAPHYPQAITKEGARVATVTTAVAIRGEGSLSPPAIREASARLEEFQLEMGAGKFRSEGPIDLRYAGGRALLQPAVLVSEDSRLQLSGSLPWGTDGEPGEVLITGEIGLGLIPAMLSVAEEYTTSGKAALEARLSGSFEHLQPTAVLRLHGGGLRAKAWPGALEEIQAEVHLRNGQITLDRASATIGSGTLELSGDLPLEFLTGKGKTPPAAVSPPAHFSVAVNKAPLAALFQLPAKSDGEFSLRLTGEAGSLALESIDAQLELSELFLRREAASIRADGPSLFRFKNGLLQIGQSRWTTQHGNLQLSGTLGLTGEYPMDVLLSGTGDAAVFSMLSPALLSDGDLRLDLRALGPLSNPLFSGSVELLKGSLGVRQPRLVAENLELKAEIDGNRLDLRQLKGVLNGGRFEGGGTASLEQGRLTNVQMNLSGQDVFLEYPAGMKSALDLNLQVHSGDSSIVIGGEVSIREGSYLDPFDFSSVGGSVDLTGSAESSGRVELLGSRLLLDVGLRTRQPLVIDNNLARLSAEADLRLVGDPGRPGMRGAITLERGGKVYFGGRTYLTELGVVTFTSESRIDPRFDVAATTQVNDYQVTLRVYGTTQEISSTFTSDPPLSQNDVVALLLTGKPASEFSGGRVDPAQAEKLSLLTGALNAEMSSRMRRRFGISQVMIQPGLVSAESDPGTRLTVGQNLSDSLQLVYSMNLANSSDQLWLLEYEMQRHLTVRGVRQRDNSFRTDFQQDIRFGKQQAGPASASPSGAPKPKVGRVEFSGSPVFPVALLAKEFKIAPGSDFHFAKARKGIERLQKFYAERDYLEARIRMDREDRNNQVDLKVRIEAGAQVRLVFTGTGVPGSARNQARKVWQEGIADRQRISEVEEHLRFEHAKRGFLQAKVVGAVSTTATGEKRVEFDSQPGSRFRRVETVFEGASQEHAAELALRIERRRLAEDIYLRPETVTEDLTLYYRLKGYYLARVDLPRFELDAVKATGRIVFAVSEGPVIRVGAMAFAGNQALAPAQLLEKNPLKPGVVLEPELLRKSMAAMEDQYGRNGYRNPEIEPGFKLDQEKSTVDITFSIREGASSFIQSLTVTGQKRVSEKYIREQLRIGQMQPQNFPETDRSIRNLYNTGAFSKVEIEAVPGTEAAAVAGGTENVDLAVKVQEVAPYKLLYGGYYDSKRGPGIIANLENRNLLGSARVLGLRTRYDKDLQEARVYLTQPLWRRHPLPTTGTLYFRRENDYYEGLSAQRVGMTLQQEATLRKKLILSYGYRLENVFTWYPDRSRPNPRRETVAPFSVTLSSNSRDDFLDPTRGAFISTSLEYAPGLLGSTSTYARFFGQYFKYFPLFKPGYAPFQGEAQRPRTIFATGVRVGLLKSPPDQPVIATERFYAGGGTTVRGFRQDTLGPLDSSGNPLGGNAMLVLNNELRFPLVSILDGVGFVDIGNVFPAYDDFRFKELRRTAGFGLRLRTPALMLRFDYGFKLDRRPGESLGAFFFSIGQAY